jgi:hypothetical protein
MSRIVLTHYSRIARIQISAHIHPLTQGHVNCISIVEAYTFNFRVRIIYIFARIKTLTENQYYNIPGTNTVVPILSLGDNLQRMSLKDKDPVTEAVLKGNAPTLREVKRSVKVRYNECGVTLY